MSDENIEALAALSGEIGAISSHVQTLEQQGVNVSTALDLSNRVLERIEAHLTNLQSSVGFLRRDVECIRKRGCQQMCNPDEPDTAPEAPSLREVSAGHG